MRAGVSACGGGGAFCGGGGCVGFVEFFEEVVEFVFEGVEQ